MNDNNEMRPFYPAVFDLSDMSAAEQKQMFLSVSVKSLGMWLTYYEQRKEEEICTLIRSIRDAKNAGVSG